MLFTSLFFSLIAISGTALFAQETVEERVAALETRIRQLESELAAVKSPASLGQPGMVATTGAVMGVSAANGSGTRPSILPAVLVTTSASPELAAAEAAESAVAMAPPPAPMPPAQQDTLGGELEGLNFFKGVTFGGFLDGYYNFNFNEPSDAISTNGGGGLNRNFDFNHNSLTLSQVDFEVMKAVNETNPLGYMVQMNFGPTANFVNGGDFGIGNSTAAHFMQYYLSGKAGALTLDFGKFVTQHGAEVIDTRADWNYSRGMLFALAIPYYHFGLRATYPASDKVTLAAFLVNGWNNVIDNNKGKTLGLQAILNPTGRISFVQNYMVGQEQASASDVRHLFDTLLTLKLHDQVTFMVNYDYGMDRVAGGHVHWQGIAGYLKFQPTSAFSLTPRFEFFSDPMGWATATRQQLKEFTITPEFIASDNLVMRFEYRHDWSNEPTFTTSGDPKDDPKRQDTLGLGLILKF